MTNKKTVHLISLGCPKNRVDSEVMLGHLVGDGYSIVERAQDAEVIVVNTCGFIDAAKEESIDTITEVARYKRQGSVKTLVVTGCLSQRYAPQLREQLPEVDYFLGTGNFETIATVLRQGRASGHHRLPIVAAESSSVAKKRMPRRSRSTAIARMPDPDFTLTEDSPRVATLPAHMAYVKVSEGCSNACAFCVIPQVRGPQRSRRIADVVAEVERLLANGCVEINLIAQDLCAFGKDLEHRQSLAQLLRALDALGDGRAHYWIRCLYAYPRGLTRDVIDTIAGSTHVLKYLDMPLQHIADSVLQRMRRGKGGSATAELVRRLRSTINDLVLRTTLITGLPGETDDDFALLRDFVEEIRFERLGVFAFSREEGTLAATMPHQVPHELAVARRDQLMELQRHISYEQQQAMLGKTIEVLIDGVSEETDLLLQGRHPGQAPEIDGLTYVTEGTAAPGDVVRVLVDQAGEYDLAGGIVA